MPFLCSSLSHQQLPRTMAVSMEEPGPGVCPECVGTLEGTRGMKGQCVHSAVSLVLQQ